MAEKYQALVSECCGAENRAVTDEGPDFSDMGLCPECREHCVFVDEDEDEEVGG